MINNELIKLKKNFSNYAVFIEQMLQKIGTVFSSGYNGKTLESLITKDESRANQMELDIDEFCMNIIAKFQPKAKSLRIIMMISKINNDLERIADQCVNIAQSFLTLFHKNTDNKLSNFSDTVDQVIQMYRDSIKSFQEENADLARNILEQDDIIDTFNRKIYNQLKEEMKKCPQKIATDLQLIRIAKNLERIADHCTNICEDVVYVVEGQVLKHGK